MKTDRGWLIIDTPTYTTIEKGTCLDCVAIDRRKLNPGQAMMALALIRERTPNAFIIGVGEHAHGISTIEPQAYNVITRDNLTTPWSYALDAIRTKHLNTKEESHARHRDVPREGRHADVSASHEVLPLHSDAKHGSVVLGVPDEHERDVRLDRAASSSGQTPVVQPMKHSPDEQHARQRYRIKLRSLAREAIRTALVAVDSTSDDPAARRAAEAKHEFNTAIDPLLLLDLLDDLDAHDR